MATRTKTAAAETPRPVAPEHIAVEVPAGFRLRGTRPNLLVLEFPYGEQAAAEGWLARLAAEHPCVIDAVRALELEIG